MDEVTLFQKFWNIGYTEFLSPKILEMTQNFCKQCVTWKCAPTAVCLSSDRFIVSFKAALYVGLCLHECKLCMQQIILEAKVQFDASKE
jgi:hypothetical protein